MSPQGPRKGCDLVKPVEADRQPDNAGDVHPIERRHRLRGTRSSGIGVNGLGRRAAGSAARLVTRDRMLLVGWQALGLTISRPVGGRDARVEAIEEAQSGLDVAFL